MKHLPRAEILLPLAILAGAGMLAISEFMVTFELTPPGAEPLDELTAADRHSYALLILAVFAVGSTMLAIGTGLRPFAFAAAGFGVAALLIFLIVDLPDAGKLGTLGGDSEFTFATAEADPQSGFLLEAVGSIVLGLATVAFATLRSDQLTAPLARFSGRGERTAEGEAKEEPAPKPKAKVTAKAKPKPNAKPKAKPAPKPKAKPAPKPKARRERPESTPRRTPPRAARDYEPFDYESKRNKPAGDS